MRFLHSYSSNINNNSSNNYTNNNSSSNSNSKFNKEYLRGRCLISTFLTAIRTIKIYKIYLIIPTNYSTNNSGSILRIKIQIVKYNFFKNIIIFIFIF